MNRQRENQAKDMNGQNTKKDNCIVHKYNEDVIIP